MNADFGDDGKRDGVYVGFIGIFCGTHEGVKLASETVEELACLGDRGEACWYFQWSF